jgi:hypothetical protein
MGKPMELIRFLKNRLFRKRRKTMKIIVGAGVVSYEITGLNPGQSVSVVANSAAGNSPAAIYTAPLPTAAPDVPVVAD